jgi:hypothetical protein
VAEQERVETESMPLTERYTPTFDTGMQPKAEPAFIEPEEPARRRRRWGRGAKADQPESGVIPTAYTEADALPSEAIPIASASGPYLYLVWWKFVLMLLAVWVPAGAVGAGLFYWWSHDASRHKTTVVFAVLAYVVVTTVVGLILSMVAERPLVSALAIAMLSAVFASVVGAAPVYGKFYCDHSQRHCVARVLPY